MTTSPAEFQSWLDEKDEDEHLDFKEQLPKDDKIAEYCVAFANEGGGKLVVGITNRKPRRAIGTDVDEQHIVKLRRWLFDKLQIDVNIEKYEHEDSSVLIFHIPAAPPGMPAHKNGRYLMRRDDSLVPIPPQQLAILLMPVGDYSATICPGATLNDLDPVAIAEMQKLWHFNSSGQGTKDLPDEEFMRAARLITDEGVTIAALVLLGSEDGIRRLMPHAEILIQYQDATGRTARHDFARGFLAIHNEVWDTIDARNTNFSYIDGLVRQDIPAYDEAVVREGILNAVCHRVYRLPGSIRITQTPTSLEILNPGGFPPGVTPENIVDSSVPRNPLLAEVFQRCELIERFGFGVDKMIIHSVQQGKRPPQYGASADSQVSLVIDGDVRDEKYARYFASIGDDTLDTLNTTHFLALDLIHEQQPVPENLKQAVDELTQMDPPLAKWAGKGVGSHPILSPDLYEGKIVDTEQQRAFILDYIQKNAETGVAIGQIMELLPSLTRDQLQKRFSDLAERGAICLEGKGRAAKWFPAE